MSDSAHPAEELDGLTRGPLYLGARLVLAATSMTCVVIYFVSIWDPEAWGSSGWTLWPYLFCPFAVGAILNIVAVQRLKFRSASRDTGESIELVMHRHPGRVNMAVLPFLILFGIALVLVFRASLGGDVYPNYNGQVYQLVFSGSSRVISRSTYHRDLRAEYLACSAFVSVLCAVALAGGWATLSTANRIRH